MFQIMNYDLSEFEFFVDGIMYSPPNGTSSVDDEAFSSIQWVTYLNQIVKLNLSFPSNQKNVIAVQWILLDNSQRIIHQRNWTISKPDFGYEAPLSVYWRINLTGMQAKFSWDEYSVSIDDESIGFNNATCLYSYCQFQSVLDIYNYVPPTSLTNGDYKFRISSVKSYIYSKALTLNCSDSNVCRNHGKCLINPDFNRFDDHSNFIRKNGEFRYCSCDSGYNGSRCENYIGIHVKTVKLYVSQSGNTDPNDQLENIFDLKNANAAEEGGYGYILCTSSNLVSVEYMIEMDSDFRSFQSMNGDRCFGCDFDSDKRVGYKSVYDQYSLPSESKCKPCDSIGTNNCRWKILSVNKIVKSQCLTDYVTRKAGAICMDEWYEAFKNCSSIDFDSSNSWVKGLSAPANCPYHISGCTGDTFPSTAVSNSGCSHSCLPCSQRSEIAYPYDLEIESLQSTGASLSWSRVNSTLYGDPFEQNINASYIVTLSKEDGSKSIYKTNTPTITFFNLTPGQKYSAQIQTQAGFALSQATIANFRTPGCKPLDASLLCNALWECGHTCILQRLGLTGICANCFEKGKFAEGLESAGTKIQDLISACKTVETSIE